MAFKSNMKSFLEQTNKAIAKELEKQKSEGKKIVITAYDAIVNLSPVDTSLFRTSNIITYNSIDDTIIKDVNNARETANKAQVGGFKFNNGDVIRIINNSVYGDRLEAGHSKQAPSGIFGVTEQRVKRLLNKKIK